MALAHSTSIMDDDVRPYQIRLSTTFWREVDAWRRLQPDIPTRAEAIRRLVEIGLVTERKGFKRQSHVDEAKSK